MSLLNSRLRSAIPSLSRASRASIVAARTPGFVWKNAGTGLRRGAHESASEQHVGHVHSPVPFSYQNKTTFAVKTIIFMSTGLVLPFMAAIAHMRRFGGA